MKLPTVSKITDRCRRTRFDPRDEVSTGACAIAAVRREEAMRSSIVQPADPVTDGKGSIDKALKPLHHASISTIVSEGASYQRISPTYATPQQSQDYADKVKQRDRASRIIGLEQSNSVSQGRYSETNFKQKEIDMDKERVDSEDEKERPVRRGRLSISGTAKNQIVTFAFVSLGRVARLV